MPSCRERPERSLRSAKRPTVPTAAPMNMVVANALMVSGSPYPIEIARGAAMVPTAARSRQLSRKATRRTPPSAS